MATSRKLYVEIAESIKAQVEATPDQQVTIFAVASRVADALKRNNPSFDCGRFYAACGL